MTAVTRRRWSALALAAAVLAAGGIATQSTPAYAAGSVTVTGPDGTATADPDYATTVAVRGSGFQAIQNGFGGVYVLFGWVDSGWQPSAGGIVGEDYRYVPDSEDKDNAGFQRFVAFAGSDTEAAAHAVMAADGSWAIEMVVPGATFESRDRDGNVSAVDCRVVTCGIITIGAHGVKNANNETFTPITFAAPAAGAPSAPVADAPASETTPSTAAQAAPGAAPIGDVRVGLTSDSVDAGTSVAFTGQGFTPGEQVVATLDNGLVSVGPLLAGASGEVAGVMPVPRDVRGGTHLVTLTGAASEREAQAELRIILDAPALAEAPAAGPEIPMWIFVALLVSIALALALVIVSAVVSIRRVMRARAGRERRTRRRDEAHASPLPEPSLLDPDVFRAPSDSGPDAPTVEIPILAGGRP